MKVAMILAAGRGERLKPLTDQFPKALCIVKGRPLIEHHVINLAKAGFEILVINHAYLGGQIRQFLGNGQHYGVTIHYSPEPPGGLETGGGIVKALPLLGNKPFLTVNADIYTDYDFNQFKLNQLNSAHLILIKKNPTLNHHGDFSLINHNQLSNENPEYTFAGIAGYNPQVFDHCKQGRYSITPLIRNLADMNKVTGSLYQGTWFDIGSIERLKAANI
jgi:MurNAc alpha-1-phosphate uridylyltransferase